MTKMLKYPEIKAFVKEIPALLLDLVRNRLEWKMYMESWASIAAALLIVPAAIYLPEAWGEENGLFENMQLLLIFYGMAVCFAARHHRHLFRVIAAILFILALRETNFGKTIFYPDPYEPNSFLSWDEIPYAPYVDPVMIAYGIGIAVYGIKTKVYLEIPAFLKKGKIPMVNLIVMGIFAAAGAITDKVCDNLVAEEMTECIFFIAFIATLRRACSTKCSWLPGADD